MIPPTKKTKKKTIFFICTFFLYSYGGTHQSKGKHISAMIGHSNAISMALNDGKAVATNFRSTPELKVRHTKLDTGARTHKHARAHTHRHVYTQACTHARTYSEALYS